MIIRTMITNDYSRVYDLWCNTKGMGLNSIDDSEDGILRYLKRNPSTCFVAEKDGKLLGAILSGHDGRRGYIYHTAVIESARSQGIGGKLLEASLNALAQAGISKVALVVFEYNEIGNSFWEKAGFSKRNDLIYRNKSLKDVTRIDT